MGDRVRLGALGTEQRRDGRHQERVVRDVHRAIVPMADRSPRQSILQVEPVAQYCLRVLEALHQKNSAAPERNLYFALLIEALAERVPKRRKRIYRQKVEGWLDELLDEMLQVEALKERFKLEGARAWIKTGFKRDDSQSWRDAAKATLQAAYDAKHDIQR
jgi:hypothetical protein